MTFVSQAGAVDTSTSSGSGGGLKRSQLIELVNKRTERKAERALDLKSEFALFLQDFCGERKWHWRRKTVTFNTAADTPTYDLVDTTIASDNASDIETIISVKLVKGYQLADILPIHGENQQSEALESLASGEPTGYFIEPGTTSVIRLVDTPNGVYKIRVMFWAVPSSFVDDRDIIPIVPPFLHNTLAKGFEAQVWRYLLGEGSAKYQACMADYMRLLDKALDKMDFATGRIREFKSTEEAIRST